MGGRGGMDAADGVVKGKGNEADSGGAVGHSQLWKEPEMVYGGSEA